MMRSSVIVRTIWNPARLLVRNNLVQGMTRSEERYGEYLFVMATSYRQCH